VPVNLNARPITKKLTVFVDIEISNTDEGIFEKKVRHQLGIKVYFVLEN